MSTTTHDWPTQLRLPGQAAAPEGPVDMQMMYVMHHAFRRDLGRFAEAAQRTPVQDRTAWRLLARRWAIFSEVLHEHHSGEDAGMWPWLLEHGTPADRSTLEAMEAEHAEIDPLLASCAEGFERLVEHLAWEAVRRPGHDVHHETGSHLLLEELLVQHEVLMLGPAVRRSMVGPARRQGSACGCCRYYGEFPSTQGVLAPGVVGGRCLD